MKPMPKDRHGKTGERRPEVTWDTNCPKVARTWVRDGEGIYPNPCWASAVFRPRNLRTVSLSSCSSPTWCLLDYDDLGKNIRQGIQRKRLGPATGYWVYKSDPLDTGTGAALYGNGDRADRRCTS